jgi:hypothetical protein
MLNYLIYVMYTNLIEGLQQSTHMFRTGDAEHLDKRLTWTMQLLFIGFNDIPQSPDLWNLIDSKELGKQLLLTKSVC